MTTTKQILEANTKLSDSILWELQAKAYKQFGIDAWNRYGVPSYITSNSYIARAYAHLVIGFIRDCLANSALKLDHPIYLLDLGAGTGRFAYFFLKEFFSFLKLSDLPKIKICYVMTDMVESNVAFWNDHPYLKTYFESGVLDRAIFHHAQKEPLHLINHDLVLTQDRVVNPLILICNYFFDTIPQDLFRVNHGKLEEGRINLTVRDMSEESVNSQDPSIINHLSYFYSYAPLNDLKSFPPKFLKLIQSYIQKIDNYPFLFPTGAFQVIDNFLNLSKSRLLVLAGDQGTCNTEQLKESKDPKLALHGSFSFPVNYQLIDIYFKSIHGYSWLTSYSDPLFVVMAASVGIKDPKETTLAFQEHLDSFEPTDYFNLVTLTEKNWKDPPLDHILLLIKLGLWDASVLLLFYQNIRALIPTATNKQKHFLSLTVDKVYEYFYPIGQRSSDFVLNLGVLLFEIHEYEKAIKYFEQANRLAKIQGDDNIKAIDNIEACKRELEKLKQF